MKGKGRRVAVVLALGVTLGACSSTATAPTTTVKTQPAASTSAATLAAEQFAAQEAGAVKAPKIPNVAPLPGPIVATPTVAKTVKNLTVTPSGGVAGTPMTIAGTGLAKDAKVTLTWSSSNDTWSTNVEPNTVNYLGRVENDVTVELDKTTTNSSGAFSVHIKAPNDWGGVHDIYAVIGKTAVAHGGFLIARWWKISPLSGPIGTPITITYGGLGAPLYQGGFSVLWDNHYAGEGMSTWTRGVGTAVIRATGPVGAHTIQVGNAISYLYLNVPQSPMPFTIGVTKTFTTTADDGPPAASIDWPVKVAPTVSEKTTLAAHGLAASSTAKMSLSKSSGAVDTKSHVSISGLKSTAPVSLVWSTVVGNRVDCTSICWDFVSVPLGTAKPKDGKVSANVTVPDGLGGWHSVQAIQNGKMQAEAPFYVHVSIVGKGLSSIVVKQGSQFTIHLKGVGWTQLDNTFAVDYDNSYVGYGCGFNSNGDLLLHLYATGAPGTHLIDLYPMLYTLSPSFAGAEYGMVPVLTYANDEPGLALGYQLPAIRFAITVVK